MLKKLLLCAALISTSAISGCSIIGHVNGFDSSWQRSGDQVFKGQLEKDSVPGVYEVRAVPTWSRMTSLETADLGYDVKFSVKIGEYSRSYTGKAVVSANYDHQDDARFLLTDLRVTKSAHFVEMEPYLFVNVWPLVNKKFEHQIETTKSLVVKK